MHRRSLCRARLAQDVNLLLHHVRRHREVHRRGVGVGGDEDVDDASTQLTRHRSKPRALGYAYDARLLPVQHRNRVE